MPRISFEQVTAEPVLAGYRYWSSKKVGNRLPARRDIDPFEIPKLLPYVILSEILTPFSVRYRLVGTKVVEMNQLDFTGFGLNEGVIGDEWKAYCAEHYRIVVATRAPLFGADRYEYRERDFQPFEWAIMPLAADGHTVDMCLEIEAPVA
jgi:hypothetical protein